MCRYDRRDIYPHVHWTPCDRGVAEDAKIVAWKLDYSWVNVNGAFPSSGTVAMLDACDGTDDKMQIASGDAIDGADKNISSMLVCRLWRDSTGDTWAGVTGAQSPAILEMDFHFESSSVGSRQPYIK